MPPRQLAFRFHGCRDMDFERFVPGPNEELLKSLRQLCAGEAVRPVYLWGAPGAGKTHLLRASCVCAAEIGPPAAYRSLAQEDAALRPWTGPETALLCLDDVQHVAGDRQRELALLGLYEQLLQGGGRLLLACAHSPLHLPLKLDDLRSRLSWGLVYRLRPLEDADKIRALQLRAQARSLVLPAEVARYLLTRFPRDMHSLFRLFERLDAGSLEAGRRLSLPFIRECLRQPQGTG